MKNTETANIMMVNPEFPKERLIGKARKLHTKEDVLFFIFLKKEEYNKT